MLVYMVGWTIWTAIQERQEFEVINVTVRIKYITLLQLILVLLP